MKEADVKKVVREKYGKIASQQSSCCQPTTSCCCGGDAASSISKFIGYSENDLAAVPDGANLGLGCGNPIALASLKPGEIVLDLGAGAGFDCFLATQKVGATGKVIGVDMTAAMIEKARDNARQGNYANVEFRLGEIEHLPGLIILLTCSSPIALSIYHLIKPRFFERHFVCSSQAVAS